MSRPTGGPSEPEDAYLLRRAETLELVARGEPRAAFDRFRWALWYRPARTPVVAVSPDCL